MLSGQMRRQGGKRKKGKSLDYEKFAKNMFVFLKNHCVDMYFISLELTSRNRIIELVICLLKWWITPVNFQILNQP